MDIIRVDKNTVDKIVNKEDMFKAISLYDNHKELALNEWLSTSLDAEHEIYALLDSDKVVAVAAVNEASDYRMNRWKEIRSLYVHPDYTDLKYGSQLIEKIVDRVDDRGFENTYTWVMEEDQDARDFFELQNVIPNGNREQRIVEGVKEEFLRYVYVNL